MRKLTKEQRRDIRAIGAKRDRDIDFSDAPPVLDWSGAEIGKFYRPAKKPVTMRLDSDVVAWLKADGPGYQTKANWLLRHAMLHFTKGDGLNKGKRLPRRGKSGRQAALSRPLNLRGRQDSRAGWDGAAKSFGGFVRVRVFGFDLLLLDLPQIS